MKEVRPEVSDDLLLLEDAEAFAKHARQIVEQTSRDLCILSGNLDPVLYDQDDFTELISQLVRSDRHAQVRILVKDISLMLERGHKLLSLARRLSSKIHIRKLLVDPEDQRHNYLLSDRGRLLYMHEEGIYRGFADYQAAPRTRQLLNDFNQLWEHHSELSPDLRNMHL